MVWVEKSRTHLKCHVHESGQASAAMAEAAKPLSQLISSHLILPPWKPTEQPKAGCTCRRCLAMCRRPARPGALSLQRFLP